MAYQHAQRTSDKDIFGIAELSQQYYKNWYWKMIIIVFCKVIIVNPLQLVSLDQTCIVL